MNSLNNVTVLLKSNHVVRQCIDKGSFSKMTSFSLENEYFDLVQFSSLELNSSKNESDPLLYQKLHHNEVEPKTCDAAQRSWLSTPILNGEQPEAVEVSEVALNNHGCIARDHPTAALSD